MQKTIYWCDRCGKEVIINPLEHKYFFVIPKDLHGDELGPPYDPVLKGKSKEVILCENCACEYLAMRERHQAEIDYFMTELIREV